jgi:hypothetical protein
MLTRVGKPAPGASTTPLSGLVPPSPANSVTRELHGGVTPAEAGLADPAGRTAPVAELAAFDAAVALQYHRCPPQPSPQPSPLPLPRTHPNASDLTRGVCASSLQLPALSVLRC